MNKNFDDFDLNICPEENFLEKILDESFTDVLEGLSDEFYYSDEEI